MEYKGDWFHVGDNKKKFILSILSLKNHRPINPILCSVNEALTKDYKYSIQ